MQFLRSSWRSNQPEEGVTPVSPNSTADPPETLNQLFRELRALPQSPSPAVGTIQICASAELIILWVRSF